MNEAEISSGDSEKKEPVDETKESTAPQTQEAQASETNDASAFPDNVIPIAKVRGSAVTELPQDLYIPPDALEVFLEAFEGPLDLLLYLIKKQNLDILDIPIADITYQYMEYVEMMKELRLELAADYLVMAAMLAEIKSRMLLPRPVTEEDEDDPRAELIRRLQEYERYKIAAEDLNTIPRLFRDVFQVEVQPPKLEKTKPLPHVELQDLLFAFKEVLTRADMYSHHHIQLEALSVRERMSTVLDRVRTGGFVEFTSLFNREEGRLGVVVSFLAVLELIKESLIELVQTEAFGPIHIKAVESCQ